jgi:ketosteroid isomerase-like protein
MPTSVTDLALRFVDRINARDEVGLAALMTEDFRFVDYEGTAGTGRDPSKVGFRAYFDAWPEYRIIVDRIVVSGDNSVLVVGRAAGSHLGPEAEARATLVWKGDVRDGLVAEWRIYIARD